MIWKTYLFRKGANDMDLLKGLPPEVAKHLVERSKGILETDEHCELHPRHLKMVLSNGEIVCPVCYGEVRDLKVSKDKAKEYYENSVDGRKAYLYKHSIVAGKNILHKGLKDFYARTEKEEAIQKRIKLLIDDVATGEAINIFFQGEPGTGKSHLAMALMQNANALANGKRFLFVNFPVLQQRIRASYDNNFSEDSEASFIKQMIDADALVLDDIASEINPLTNQGNISSFADRILYSVMEGRAERKPTIFTSNITWDKLQQFLDPRIVSRISYRFNPVSFDGINDKRKVAK